MLQVAGSCGSREGTSCEGKRRSSLLNFPQILNNWLALWIYKLLSFFFHVMFTGTTLNLCYCPSIFLQSSILKLRKLTSCLRSCIWFIAQRNLNSCSLSKTLYPRLSACEFHSFTFLLLTDWSEVNFQKAIFQKRRLNNPARKSIVQIKKFY